MVEDTTKQQKVVDMLENTSKQILSKHVAFVSIGAIFPDGVPAWQFIGLNGDLGISKAAELSMPYSFIITYLAY